VGPADPSTHARAAARTLSAPASVPAQPPGSGRLPVAPVGQSSTPTAPGGTGGATLLHASHDGAGHGAFGAKDLLGLRAGPQTGQAMMLVMLALAAMGLLALLFAKELQEVLARVTQRPRS
jgi:hypothetical protein